MMNSTAGANLADCGVGVFKAILSAILLLGFAQAGYAGEAHVDKQAKNRATFTSEVVLHTFSGVTDRVDGYLYWEGDQLFQRNTQFRFEVELNTLDTDNGKRNRDMQQVLDTAKWPLAIFEGGPASIVKVDSTVTAFRIMTKGKMSIHGVQRDIEVPGLLTVENGRMRIKASFIIKLSNFSIKAPSLVAFVKVSDDIGIDLDFYLKDVK